MNFTNSIQKHITKLVGTLKSEEELQEVLKRKFTRKEYKTWVSDFACELKEQIKVSTLLDPTKAKERIEQQKSDFHYFRRTYFPHYYSLDGISKLQDELETIYYKIIDDLKPMGLKFAIAAPRGFGKSTDVSIAFPICIPVFLGKL